MLRLRNIRKRRHSVARGCGVTIDTWAARLTVSRLHAELTRYGLVALTRSTSSARVLGPISCV